MNNCKSSQVGDALWRVPGCLAGPPRPAAGTTRDTRPRGPAGDWHSAGAAGGAAFRLGARPTPLTGGPLTAGVASGSGGTFTLSGTAGQPDAGLLDGGVLAGGFWALIAPVPPGLSITQTGGHVFISWPSPSTGFNLQVRTSLVAGSWTYYAGPPNIQDNGVIKSLTLTASATPHYYRLSNP